MEQNSLNTNAKKFVPKKKAAGTDATSFQPVQQMPPASEFPAFPGMSAPQPTAD